MAEDSLGQEGRLDDFEKAQDALRRSIEESKRLAKKSQSLLDQHRQNVPEQKAG